ncbi:MAG: PKD domain-containing protein [Acidobacteriaceae bacterium]|nr:PKD domain-containing protein [Acidobacteriaceae bacterium]MBV9779161.1 PKD domain-containing protein [Acidobacteriaceae bacterium]
MKTRLTVRPISSAILAGALSCCTLAYAQDTSKASNKTNNSSADQYPDIVEIDPFGGVSTYGQVMRGLDTKLVDGGVVGLRLTWNMSRWVGLELMGSWDRANVEFRLSSGTYPPGNPLAGAPLPAYSFHNAIYDIALNPVFYLKPRGSKVQPYLTVGVGARQFTPDSDAERFARLPTTDALYHSANLNDNLQVAVNYGGGIKFHLSDHFGLRLDARGFWSRNPTFDLPNYPDGGIYIPAKDKLNGFEGTLGLVWYLGQSKCPPMPEPPPPPAPLSQGAITGAEGATICQGKPVTLHSTASGAAGHKLSYAWKLNGAASGTDSPDFTFTPNNTGSFTVEVTVTDTTPPPAPMTKPKNFPARCWIAPPAPQAPAPVTATTTITVSEVAPEITNISATPNTLSCAANTSGTHTAALSVTANPSACGGNLTYKWTVTEGSVSNDTSANATFDASTLNFEGGAQGQTKTVTATATVTDETGKTASKTVDISVNCPPQFVRLSDVIFAKNNARVNNCGKRILIDEAAPRSASGDYDIVLVGHRDSDEQENVAGAGRRERARRRAAAARRALDEQRALNCAAVLSAGTGTCGKVDPSRIRVDWVGTDQTSDPEPGLCGTSNLAAQKERRGSKVSAADKNRRVEVYLVPRNTTAMPPAVKNIKPLPESEVKALGCPR